METGLTGFDEVEIPGGDDPQHACAPRWRGPTPDRLLVIAQALRLGMAVEEIHADLQVRPLVPARDRARRRRRGSSVRADGLPQRSPTACCALKKLGFSDARLAELAGKTRSRRSRQRARRLGVTPVYKRIDTCAAEFASATPYMYSSYEGDGARPPECEAEPTRPAQGHHPRRRPEPHRPGHRVRLLLRPRRLRAEGGRLRDHHGQLQPGDGLDRLRHLRPALFRAADRRGRDRAGARRAAPRHARSASSCSSAARRR